MIETNLLDQLRSLHSVPLCKWLPHTVNVQPDMFHLVYVPFTISFTCTYQIDASLDETITCYLLEWDYRHRLSIVTSITDSPIQVTLSSDFEYLFIVKGYGTCYFPWYITETTSAQCLHEGFSSLLQEYGIPISETQLEYRPFTEFLDLSQAVSQDSIITPDFQLTYEEQQRCVQKKYIAYKRINYLKVLLNQIACYTEFKHQTEFIDNHLESLCQHLNKFHSGWDPKDPFFPLFVRRYFQHQKQHRFYPYVFHICKLMGGYSMMLSSSQYRMIIDMFMELERRWDEKAYRHNFPYFQLVIQCIMDYLEFDLPYRLIFLKNVYKQECLEKCIKALLYEG